MKKLLRIISTFCIALVVSLMIITPVSAKTQEIEKLKLKMELSDDVIVLTDKLSTADPVWAEAGITDAKAKKDEFEKMGVIVSLYKKETSTYIDVLSKTSTKSHDIYNLSEISEEELNSFIKGLSETEDKNAVISSELYTHPQIPFYKVDIEVSQNGVKVKEIIYGTVVNGASVFFDIYNSTGVNIDEEFLKEVVDSVSFTEITPREEAYAAEKEAAKNMRITGIIFIVILVLVIAFFVMRSKKKAKQREEFSKRMEEFKKELKENRDSESMIPCFTNVLDYDKEVVKEFIMYDRNIKNIPVFVISGIAIFVIAMYIISSSGSISSLLILAVLVGVYIYMQVTTTEKQTEILKKRFETPEHNIIQFYDDYFSVKHIGSVIEYPYMQITRIMQYKDYIYLYVGTGIAVYLKKENFQGKSSEDFLKFIKEKKQNCK